MQEFFKNNQTINCAIPESYESFWNNALSYYDPKRTFRAEFNVSNHDLSKILKYFTTYEISILKEISYYNSLLALKYAFAMKQPISELEPVIAANATTAYAYACDILQSKFELGESAISKCARSSYFYSTHALNERFSLGEKSIAKTQYFKILYEEYFEITLEIE
jgi:hypothetical protein